MNRIILVPFATILLTATADAGCDSDDGPCPTEGAVRGAGGDCACPDGTRFEHTGNDPGACVPRSDDTDAGVEHDGGSTINAVDGGRDSSFSRLDSGESHREPPENEWDAGADSAVTEAPLDATQTSATRTDASGPFAGDSGPLMDSTTTSCVPRDEICDNLDNDCDGQIDEALIKAWYPDCDGDGYATLAGSVQQCTAPASTPSCLAWLEQRPVVGETVDCNDLDTRYRPGAGFGLPILFTGEALPPSGDLAYDLDCNGVLEIGDDFTLGVVDAGNVVVVDPCPEEVTCLWFEQGCVTNIHFQGEYKCGTPIGDGLCSPQGQGSDAYFVCR